MKRSGSERRNLAARVRNIRSQRAKGAVGRWQMKAWSGQKLLEEFSAMDTDKSNGVDQGELAVFLEPLNLGKLCPEDLQELFEFLDVDKDGIISVQDFSTAVVIPMQEEQMERAIDTKELGGLFADALPLPQIGEDGTMSNALEEVVKLSALEIEKLLAQTIPKIAATIHSRLQPHRDALKRAKHVSQPGPTSTKFMFEYADVSQELEFVNSPASGMLYPGEGPGGRRRQDAVAAWRSEHAELPVAEALKGFKSRLAKVDAEIVTRQVASALARHGSEEDKDRAFAGELRRALVQSLFQPEEMDAHEAGEVAGNVEEEVFKTAAHGRWMGESERIEWVERQLKREVRELQEAIAAWDLSLVEVKAVMLYTGSLFEKYNAVLRKLGPRGEDLPFRTTILTLISAVMKMRKRTTLSGARKVYRGLKDGELPVTWVLEGRFGSKGGAERGFLSTSLSWEEAAKYAAWGSNPVLLEIDLGQIDKGADVSRLSQYPAEKEVLFPPMSNLEVLGMPRLETFNGRSIMVLSIRANVSLRNATREELQAKRKAVFLPSLTNIVQEIERDLDLIVSSGQPRSEVLLECRFWVKETVMKNVQSLVAQYEARAPGWFQVDQHYHSVHPSLGISPFECLDGFNPRTPLTLNIQQTASEASKFMQRLVSRIQSAHNHFRQVQLRQAEQLDRKRVPAGLAVGDYALLSTKDLSLSSPTKFTPRYLGPFKVLEVKANGNAVKLELPPTLKIEPVLSTNRLRKFKAPDPNHGPSSVAQPPPVMVDDDGEYYEIELIVGERTIRMRGRNVIQYQIKWKVHDASWNTRKAHEFLINEPGGPEAISLWQARQRSIPISADRDRGARHRGRMSAAARRAHAAGGAAAPAGVAAPAAAVPAAPQPAPAPPAIPDPPRVTRSRSGRVLRASSNPRW